MIIGVGTSVHAQFECCGRIDCILNRSYTAEGPGKQLESLQKFDRIRSRCDPNKFHGSWLVKIVRILLDLYRIYLCTLCVLGDEILENVEQTLNYSKYVILMGNYHNWPEMDDKACPKQRS